MSLAEADIYKMLATENDHHIFGHNFQFLNTENGQSILSSAE